jgi:hypothetical protein
VTCTNKSGWEVFLCILRRDERISGGHVVEKKVDASRLREEMRSEYRLHYTRFFINFLDYPPVTE